MSIATIPVTPFAGQTPGTSGLRKRTREFMEPHYLQAYLQAVFNALGGVKGATLVMGADGRYFSDRAAQIFISMAAANGAAKVITGQEALLSTPAVSHLIRKRKAFAGVIFSASHNPGGVDEDFGVKLNLANGGPAPDKVTEAVVAASRAIREYVVQERGDVALDKIATLRAGAMEVEVIDPVADYLALMETEFDLDAIAAHFQAGFRVRFDAMHAVTGPYAKVIFEGRLGAPEGTVIRATPLPDFGGGHPDPTPAHVPELVAEMMSPDAPDFGAASDGDGDRNLIHGRGMFVAPSDCLAILAANAHLVPAFRAGLRGVARSMPTSRAVDRVAEARGFACYETPTGWKYFGNLLDAGLVGLCGEESAGAGGAHLREKDGIWAVLFWLNILASRKISVAALMAAHWAEFGRHYYARHDYEEIDAGQAAALMEALRASLPGLSGQALGGKRVCAADEFHYHDPVDGSDSGPQGIRVSFDCGARIVFRLSGTGTSGATLRVYLEDYAKPDEDHAQLLNDRLGPLAALAEGLARISHYTGRTGPDVIA